MAKLNAFDFIVTVALGSTLATVLLSADDALAEGITAFALLVGLQFVVAWVSSHSRRMERLVKAEPSLLFRHGYLHSAMRRERISEDEIRQAARGQGQSDLSAVAAVVLETDGILSVLAGEPPESLHR